MRYEDCTYRETEVRLREHVELRAALALKHVPDYTTLYLRLRRIGEDEATRLLQETVRQMPPPQPRGRRWPSTGRASRPAPSAPSSSTGPETVARG